MGMKTKVKKSIDADIVLIGDALGEFVAEKEARNLAPATIENYCFTIKLFGEFCGFDDDSSTDEITQQMVYKWIGTLKLEGVKVASINHYLRDLRTFLYWCMNEDRKYIYPAFKVQLIVGQEEQLKTFTDDELEVLLEKPKKNANFAEWRTWAIINWVLGTGNRAATICDVRIEDIDFKKKDITLHHTKNKKAQIIPLSSSLETVLKEFMRVWRAGEDKEEYLFCNIGGEQLTTNALRQAFEKYCTDRGINKSNIHGLRHNFAKGWVQNNGNMFALQKILGHSSLDMTRKYVKLFSEDIKEDFDKFSPLDSIKRSARRTQKVKRNDY